MRRHRAEKRPKNTLIRKVRVERERIRWGKAIQIDMLKGAIQVQSREKGVAVILTIQPENINHPGLKVDLGSTMTMLKVASEMKMTRVMFHTGVTRHDVVVDEKVTVVLGIKCKVVNLVLFTLSMHVNPFVFVE